MSDRDPDAASGVLLAVAYDGRPFCGFAQQRSARTVAGELLHAVRRLDPSVAGLRGASRTDAGVHARGQLVAFDGAASIPPRGWALGLAKHLPDEIAVRAAARVPPGFDPRRHAARKHYRYSLLLDERRDPFLRGLAWRLDPRLDLERMRAEAALLVGAHDFAAFRCSQDRRASTRRTIFEVAVSRAPREPRLVTVDLHGNGFLHNMVRIVVGTLVHVGSGRLAPAAVARALRSGERRELGPTAPAHGLCLESIALDEAAAVGDSWPAVGEPFGDRPGLG
jgi:tRNA pseudouridine38-40 synthase